MLETGWTREMIQFLIDNNISFYEKYMPADWKKELVLKLGPKTSSDFTLTDDMLALIVEAISEEIPWFAEVVTREKAPWLINEMALALKDMRKAYPQS